MDHGHLQQLARTHGLHEDTLRILAAHGYLDASVLTIYDFPQENMVQEASSDSEVSSLASNLLDTGEVLLPATPAFRVGNTSKGQGKSKDGPSAMPTAKPKATATATARDDSCSPRIDWSSNTRARIWKFGKKRKFHRAHCHHLQRPEVSAPHLMYLCHCSAKLDSPEQPVFVDASDIAHVYPTCSSVDRGSGWTPLDPDFMKKMRHCRQCLPI